MVNRWRTVAIVLIVVILVELAYAWKNWDAIALAYKNRKIIGDVGAVAGGAAALGPAIRDVAGEVKSLFQ